MFRKFVEWLIVSAPYPWFIKKRLWNLFPSFESWYGDPKNRLEERHLSDYYIDDAYQFPQPIFYYHFHPEQKSMNNILTCNWILNYDGVLSLK